MPENLVSASHLITHSFDMRFGHEDAIQCDTKNLRVIGGWNYRALDYHIQLDLYLRHPCRPCRKFSGENMTTDRHTWLTRFLALEDCSGGLLLLRILMHMVGIIAPSTITQIWSFTCAYEVPCIVAKYHAMYYDIPLRRNWQSQRSRYSAFLTSELYSRQYIIQFQRRQVVFELQKGRT